MTVRDTTTAAGICLAFVLVLAAVELVANQIDTADEAVTVLLVCSLFTLAGGMLYRQFR